MPRPKRDETTQPEPPDGWRLILFAIGLFGSVAAFCGMAVFDGELRDFCTRACAGLAVIVLLTVKGLKQPPSKQI